MTPTAIKRYRAVLGVLGLIAIIYSVVHYLGRPGFSPTDYFSFFTELSNLFAAIIFLVGATRPDLRRSATFELLRGACVLYMLTTGIVYAALLSGQNAAIPWVNTVQHRVMPAAVALDWLIDPPGAPLALRRAVLWWMTFPVLYIAYTLLRGPLAHWYPYFFVNPHHSGGYLWVAASVIAIGVGQIAMGAGIVAVGNARGRRTDSARSGMLETGKG